MFIQAKQFIRTRVDSTRVDFVSQILSPSAISHHETSAELHEALMMDHQVVMIKAHQKVLPL